MAIVEEKTPGTVREQIEGDAARLSEKAKGLSEDVRGAVLRAEKRVEEAAETAAAASGARLNQLASGVRSTSKRLRDGEVSVADRLEMLADRLEETAGYLERSKARDFVRDARHRSREHPAVLAGAAFAVGLLAGLLWSRASRAD